ncbi:MAG: hypothetical protein WBF08_04370 [Candidatus Bathyarchaeia archaeon]
MKNAEEITKTSKLAGIAKKECVQIVMMNICCGSYGIKVWLNEYLDCGRKKNLVQDMVVDE